MDSVCKFAMAKVDTFGDVVQGQVSSTNTVLPPAPGAVSHCCSDCMNGKCTFLLIDLY